MVRKYEGLTLLIRKPAIEYDPEWLTPLRPADVD
jgi:hypothetical protein